ncbi:DNA-binding transcriptional regulator LsrR (DeoR family) [Cryobacterium mesophilum]|uniref:sugar-binding transcriptional regulator n=1 Tax=Terrimesophilobacter mesophilus TaxID=433647 RepID=UPI00142575E3|nr:sugar-binding domain-containing protein [Terrimesophilobacter mesophilus]MBB5633342.1 DNA-binding transcriptional regulator LsrR (DeoR family) [Terrimesophilobacter mesophilus]
MGRKASTQEDSMLRLVAHLYYVRELNLKEISEITSLSPATISRMNRLARERKVVTISVAADDSDFDDISARLSEQLDTPFAITPGHRVDSIKRSRISGAAAAPTVLERLPYDGIVGLSAGHTINGMLASLGKDPRPRLGLLPLMGGWNAAYPHLDANTLVRGMAERFQATSYPLHAPALCDTVESRRTILLNDTVRATTERWDHLDAAVYGIGAPGMLQTSTYAWTGSDDAKIAKEFNELGVVGNILGHLYDIDGKIVQHEWTERLITVSLEQLERVKTSIALLCGETKVKALVGLARTGMSSLIITDDLTALSTLEFLADEAAGA